MLLDRLSDTWNSPKKFKDEISMISSRTDLGFARKINKNKRISAVPWKETPRHFDDHLHQQLLHQTDSCPVQCPEV